MTSVVLLGALFGLVAASAESKPETGVPPSRLARLQTGANVTLWFRGGRAITDDHLANYMGDDEIDTMRRMGLKHVRLCVVPRLVMDPETGEPKQHEWSYVEKAIDKFLAHNLAVVVDMHNENRLDEANPVWREHFVNFWKVAARRVSHYDPEMVLLEIVNEPVYTGHEAEWAPFQEQLVAAIRAGAPDHTIVATGPNWSNINGGLLILKPLADRNLVYTFHCYDPHPFTHQGATWSSRDEEPLRRVPYPSTPELIAPLLAGLPSDSRVTLLKYGDERWNHAKMEENFKQAVEWGRRYKVPLYCGEFGVYPRFSLPEHRANWFQDFGDVLRKYHIGWCVWGWDDQFGIGRRHVAGKLVLDELVVKSLGLKQP